MSPITWSRTSISWLGPQGIATAGNGDAGADGDAQNGASKPLKGARIAGSLHMTIRPRC